MRSIFAQNVMRILIWIHGRVMTDSGPFDRAVSMLPAKAQLLAYAAKMPSGLRSSFSIRLFGALNRRTPRRPDLSKTNLGLGKIEWLIPTARNELLFGAPRFWVGERSTLALS